MSDFNTQLEDGLKKIDIWGGRVHDALGQSLIIGALMIERDAKQNTNSNSDSGTLMRSISPTALKLEGESLSISVGPTVKYAPNLEYGSSPHTTSTNSEEFVESITLWGKRKGLDDYEIFQLIKHIRKYGTKPHPFLGPAYYSNIEKIKLMIKTALGKA